MAQVQIDVELFYDAQENFSVFFYLTLLITQYTRKITAARKINTEVILHEMLIR